MHDRSRVARVCLCLGMCVSAPVVAAPSGVCAGGANQTVVRFTYGSEKESWIKEVTATFNGQNEQTTSGRSICVEAIPMGSGDSVRAIRDGQAGPEEIHATSPASDLYVNLANSEWERDHGSDLLKGEGFLVSSPVVIAAWQPVVEQLGDPARIGWSTIFDRAADAGFRYGQTNPVRSNSGLSALVAQFYAGATHVEGKPVLRLSESRVADPQVREFVSRVHDNVIHYGRSTGFYARKMTEGGPAYADAVVIYESDVIQANASIRSGQSGYPPLVAIYPQEGTFVANHPYAIVNRDWVDADEEEGARRYFDFLMQPGNQAVALQYGFRPGIALDIDPGIYAKVWNADNGVAPFDAVHSFLAAPRGQVIADILAAFRAIKNNAHVVLVLDRSRSMSAQVFDQEEGRKRSRIEMAVESANLLAERMQEKDRLSLMFYDYTPSYSELTPRGKPLAMTPEGKQRLAQALGHVTPRGGTAMRGAIYSAWKDLCNEIKAHPEDRSIRLLVVLTDGIDNASTISAGMLIRKIGYEHTNERGQQDGDPACRIPVFGVAFSEDADTSVLRSITSSAGGETRQGNSSDIRAIFARFADLL